MNQNVVWLYKRTIKYRKLLSFAEDNFSFNKNSIEGQTKKTVKIKKSNNAYTKIKAQLNQMQLQIRMPRFLNTNQNTH